MKQEPAEETGPTFGSVGILFRERRMSRINRIQPFVSCFPKSAARSLHGSYGLSSLDSSSD
jgi:hypothetical protein